MLLFLKLVFALSLCVIFIATEVQAQDYEVADITCAFSGSGHLSARLRKPDGFVGDPVFADARRAGPENNRHCHIQQDIR